MSGGVFTGGVNKLQKAIDTYLKQCDPVPFAVIPKLENIFKNAFASRETMDPNCAT